MKHVIKYTSIIILLALSACAKPDVENEATTENNTVNTINIPEGFDYRTHRKVSIKINDNSNAIYEVFVTSNDSYFAGTQTYLNESDETVTEDVYRDDIINKQVLKGVTKNGILEQSITLPMYCTEVYIRRNDNLRYSGELVSVVNDEVNYMYQDTPGRNITDLAKNGVKDYLFCVNGEGDLFQVDPLDGSSTYLSEMPMGSYTAAIDQEHLVLYSIGRSSPHPLMKYDIQTGEWSTVANMNFGGPRLDYNINDNLLYFSNKDYIRTIDPLTGQVLNEWDVNGIHNLTGGDLKFDENDGTLYLASFSGLYRCEFNGSSYDAIRLSADNLPFTPTSMTIDSNGDLWLADANTDGNLIIMDTVTGGWQYVYGANAGNGTNFGRRINDLTTFRIFSDTPDTTDTDGDGIVDSEDAFPEEADKAFEMFTPSKYGTGTIAFEDLWPSNGDYDFNDMALNYKAIAILNSDNLAVQVDLICKVKSNLAGYTNGVGIEIEGLTSNQIENVVGTIYTENYITLNANGTEANQDRAVVILTDDAGNLTNETTISIILNNPITTETLGAAPFNPFIIANKVRENEIHLPYRNATSLGESLVEVEGHNNDPNGNYISNNGYPWAISIIHDFKVPKESVKIYDAYNYFNNWAISGGQDFKDWYKDNPGHRNQNLLKN
ncbi:LruC domain-containing protein [Winogradskyella sp.]|uniref:LruC domain-containing protein n=1 Tax=Winogradskyella sp. TaxID=1883156 RepID=UPI002604777D|nr:LruC domain-containing protein [Winogradskyella sp.]